MTVVNKALMAVAEMICREYGVAPEVAPVLLHLQAQAILEGHTTVESSFAWLEERGFVEWETPETPGAKRTFRVTDAGLADYRAMTGARP